MADINKTISLGIGTPAGIPEFLLFGLQPEAPVPLTVPGLEYTLPQGRMHYTIPEED